MKRRPSRVAEAIRRLASEIVHGHLKDPRIRGFITITKAEITPDLRFAKIYYSALEDDKKKKLIAEGLKSAKNFIKRQIAAELKLRYAPDVSFILDQSFTYRERIDKIFDELHKEADNENDRENNKSD